MIRAALLALLACACGGSGPGRPDAHALADAPTDGGFGTCEGACRTTTLSATFGSDTRMFDRAVYGYTAAAQTLHIEAYKGGDPGCPTASSATPSYTTIIGDVAVPTSTAPITASGSVLDFVGDLLDGPVGAQATAVTVTPVAVDAPVPPGSVALDVTMTFAAGTISGHLFATHCASLDE